MRASNASESDNTRMRRTTRDDTQESERARVARKDTLVKKHYSVTLEDGRTFETQAQTAHEVWQRYLGFETKTFRLLSVDETEAPAKSSLLRDVAAIMGG